jgi:hypothetical protein
MRFSAVLFMLVGVSGLSLWAAPPDRDAAEVVQGAIDYWRDVSSYAVVGMTVHRPEWERRALMRAWTRGEKDSLVRFVEPAKDAGSATLKVGDDMWVFTPKLNRVIKLPFSMMAQSWMGSDFSYNDLAKSDQITVHYQHRLVSTEEQDGHQVLVIESVPLEDAPVTWGKEVLKIRDDHLLLEEVFFDQDSRPVKRLRALEIGELDGKVYVTRLRMEQLEKEDHWTELVYREARFGVELTAGLFTRSNLRNPRVGWEPE